MSAATHEPSVSQQPDGPLADIDSGTQELVSTLGAPGKAGRAWTAAFILVALAGLGAWIYQLKNGLRVTAMNNYFSWGVYIINFVFFIGISMAGTLISAMLRITGAHWRRPITRLAEAITLFSLLVAGPLIIVDMGRPDRFLHVLLYGRLQSPILWDVLSLTTYMVGSMLYLYLPLIPDLAMLRDHPAPFPAWRRRLYRVLAMGWRNSPEQHRRLERAIAILAVVIIPVAVSIHTVTSWIFGMTLRPGWHSTIIGPDFVVGALYSGIAAVITAIALFRSQLKLHRFITEVHFKKLSLLLLTFGLAYAYFMANEYAGPHYTKEVAERAVLWKIFHGVYAVEFWSMVGIGLVAPILLLSLPWTRTIRGIVIASVLVNIGMWLKRYIIIIPTLSSPFMPTPVGVTMNTYVPTIVEWTITAGAFAVFCLLFSLFARIVPIVSMWEVAEGSRQPAPGQDSPSPLPHDRPEAGAAGTSISRTGVIALLVLALAGGWASSARAEPVCCTTAATKPAVVEVKPAVPVEIEIKTQPAEKGRTDLVASLKSGGAVVKDAKVLFAVRRSFGDMVLGEDASDDDGTAAVPFPADLPGDVAGRLEVVARVKSPEKFAGAAAVAFVSGARPVPAAAASDPAPRALWSREAPWALLLTIAVFVFGAWGTYAYVLGQILRIRKG